MDEVFITFKDSAFKHGATKADICHACETQRYDEPMPGEDNKYLLLGFSVAGNLLEVMYNEVEEDKIKVFHAMPCRPQYLALLEEQNG
jgi:hypothetical protein